jgi:hypothetical protein
MYNIKTYSFFGIAIASYITDDKKNIIEDNKAEVIEESPVICDAPSVPLINSYERNRITELEEKLKAAMKYRELCDSMRDEYRKQLEEKDKCIKGLEQDKRGLSCDARSLQGRLTHQLGLVGGLEKNVDSLLKEVRVTRKRDNAGLDHINWTNKIKLHPGVRKLDKDNNLVVCMDKNIDSEYGEVWIQAFTVSESGELHASNEMSYDKHTISLRGFTTYKQLTYHIVNSTMMDREVASLMYFEHEPASALICIIFERWGGSGWTEEEIKDYVLISEQDLLTNDVYYKTDINAAINKRIAYELFKYKEMKGLIFDTYDDL